MTTDSTKPEGQVPSYPEDLSTARFTNALVRLFELVEAGHRQELKERYERRFGVPLSEDRLAAHIEECDQRDASAAQNELRLGLCA
ncbi:MAG: hypothetical protein H6863_00345 [Rhodospirillales bacterium]|nr:hypothetical protein [Rhodospirillales bacterium]MCB9979571.1 hypothetical protein [Rhodospirillales bacterium]